MATPYDSNDFEAAAAAQAELATDKLGKLASRLGQGHATMAIYYQLAALTDQVRRLTDTVNERSIDTSNAITDVVTAIGGASNAITDVASVIGDITTASE
jgi:hypothetical protein